MNPDRKGMTRRDFLISAGTLAPPAALLALQILNPDWPQAVADLLTGDREKRDLDRDSRWYKSKEEREILDRILAYRKKIGLWEHVTVYPKESFKEELVLPEGRVAAEGTGYMDSVINLGVFTTETLLGDRAKLYVETIGPIENSAGNFDYRAARMGIRSGVGRYDLSQDNSYFGLLYTLIHESGHSVDPTFRPNKIFTKSEYLKVLEGRWRALSRAFSVDGKYMSDPEAYGAKGMFTDLGASFGSETVAGLEKDKKPGRLFAKGEYVDELTRYLGKDIEKVKFNRKTCLRLGKKIFADVIAGRAEPAGNWFKVVQGSIESGCAEIWANMVADVIFGAVDDPDIVGGVVDVLAVAGGRTVDLDLIRLRLQKQGVPAEIMEANRREMEKATKVQSAQIMPIPQPERVPGQVVIKPDKVTDYQRKQQEIASFYEMGSHGEDSRSRVVEYAKALQQVCAKFTVLKNQDSRTLEFWGSFDPALHIWEIRRIEEACDRRIVIGILDENVPFSLPEYVATLEDFLRSEAFNTSSPGASVVPQGLGFI